MLFINFLSKGTLSKSEKLTNETFLGWIVSVNCRNLNPEN